MRKINRKKADSEILRAYEDMRFQRRYPQLETASWIIRACAYGGLIPVFFLPADVRLTWATGWMIFVGIVVVLEIILAVAWQPRGRRMKTFFIIFGAFGAVIALVYGLSFLLFSM